MFILILIFIGIAFTNLGSAKKCACTRNKEEARNRRESIVTRPEIGQNECFGSRYNKIKTSAAIITSKQQKSQYLRGLIDSLSRSLLSKSRLEQQSRSSSCTDSYHEG